MYLGEVIEKLKKDNGLVAMNVMNPMSEYMTYRVGEFYKNGDTIIKQEEIYSLPGYGWIVRSVNDFRELSSIEAFIEAMFGFSKIEDDSIYALPDKCEIASRIGSNTPSGEILRDFVVGMHQQYSIDDPICDAEVIYWLSDNGYKLIKDAEGEYRCLI